MYSSNPAATNVVASRCSVAFIGLSTEAIEDIEEGRMDSRLEDNDKGNDDRKVAVGCELVMDRLLTVGAENRGEREEYLTFSSGRNIPRLNRTCGENFDPSV